MADIDCVKRAELDRRLSGYATLDWLKRNYTMASAFRAGMDLLIRKVGDLERMYASAASSLRGLADAVSQFGDVPSVVCSVESASDRLDALQAEVDGLSRKVSDVYVRNAPVFPLVDVGEQGAAALTREPLAIGDACVTSVPAGPLVVWRASYPDSVFRFIVPPPEVLDSGVRVARDFVVTVVFPRTLVDASGVPYSRWVPELELSFEPAPDDEVAFRTRGGDVFTLTGAGPGVVASLRFTEVAPAVLAVTRTMLEDYP